MKKKTLALLLAMVCSFSLAACSGGATETTPVAETETELEEETTVEEEIVTETAEETEVETEEVAQEETEVPAAQTPAELSDDLYSFQVAVNGTVYQLPMWYSDFEALGWTYDGDNTQTLTSNQYSVGEYWTKDGFTINTDLANLSLNSAPMSECIVAGLTFDKFDFEECNWEVMLPGGIQYGVSTTEDIIAAYGDPTSDYDSDLYYKLSYKYDSYQEISLYVYKESNVLEEIDIRNMIELEGADNSIDPTVPDVVKNYQAPTALGDDLYTYNFELDGKLYSLPCPVSVLLENGFTLNEEGSTMEVGADSYGRVELRYNNQTFSVFADNHADYATIIQNCFITSIETSGFGPELPLTIPCNIKRGDSEDALKEAIKDFNYEVDDSSENFTYYEITNPNGSATNRFTITIRDGVVFAIEIANDELAE